jgi:hypothetical protein
LGIISFEGTGARAELIGTTVSLLNILLVASLTLEEEKDKTTSEENYPGNVGNRRWLSGIRGFDCGG